MTHASLAELVLSLVSPGERARAAVGDLLERTESGSTVRLWTTILRMTGAQLFHDWRTSAARLTLEAFLLWLLVMVGTVILSFAIYLLWACLHVADNHTGLELLTTFLGWRVPLTPPEWISYWMTVALLPTYVAWSAGIRSKAPQQGLALWTASIIVWTFLGVTARLPMITLILPPLALLGGVVRSASARRSRPD
jgi:hypothetical protein